MKTVQDYMQLPYNYLIRPVTDESGSYFYASVLELDGCQSTGDSFSEAYQRLREAMEGWIEIKLEKGFPVPQPLNTDNFSGRFTLSLPKSLHFQLALEAEKEGVSLNDFILYKLSRYSLFHKNDQ